MPSFVRRTVCVCCCSCLPVRRTTGDDVFNAYIRVLLLVLGRHDQLLPASLWLYKQAMTAGLVMLFASAVGLYVVRIIWRTGARKP